MKEERKLIHKIATAQAPGSQAGKKRCSGCVWGNKVYGVCTQPRCIKGLEEKHESAGSL